MVAAATLDITQTYVLAAGAEPAQTMEASQGYVLVTDDSAGGSIRATQAYVLVAVAGRISNPKVRIWGFTLDGHDYIVIRCGDIETLILDRATGEWYVWGSANSNLWKANRGINWVGTRKLPGNYGSNVLVGDDTSGALYFLDPDYPFEDHSISGSSRKIEFKRQMIAQHVIDAGYSFPPCFGVQLFGSIGDTDAGTTTLTVQLEYSDDRGKSWVDAGSLTVPEDDYDFRLHWQSLGSMRAPGRLFRITDYGAVKRVDDFEIEDGQDG